MSPGVGGWVLRPVCKVCGARGDFRGVVPDLATKAARAQGWAEIPERFTAYVVSVDATCVTCRADRPEST